MHADEHVLLTEFARGFFLAKVTAVEDSVTLRVQHQDREPLDLLAKLASVGTVFADDAQWVLLTAGQDAIRLLEVCVGPSDPAVLSHLGDEPAHD